MKKFSHLFFDCDGVILNSNKIKTKAFYKIGLQFGESEAKKLVDYFNVLENNMVEDEYLTEGSITEFTGIHFDDDNPYSYREGKRQLKLLVNKIRKNKILNDELNVDLKAKGRSGIKKEGNLWDYLTFKTGIKQKSFTDEPHLTIGMSDKFIEADFTIPYRIKGKTKS